ncbi:hypothetical protein V1524DRAFT_416584 [Lipomyces starkeyi]
MFPLSAAHQTLADYFLDEIKQSIPLGLRSRVRSSGHSRSLFVGQWGLFGLYVSDNKYEWVSDSMQKLERDAQMCLRNEVRVCILVCVDETPSYRMPPLGIVGPDINIAKEAAAANAAMSQNRMNAVNVGSPLIYRGHAW